MEGPNAAFVGAVRTVVLTGREGREVRETAADREETAEEKSFVAASREGR
jgi:hypothetical protein